MPLPYSTNPDSNGTALGINIAELCAAGNINGAIRILMADLTTWYNAAQPLIATIAAKQPGNPVLTALAGAGAAADRMPYYTASDQAALTPISSLGAALLGAATAVNACDALGAARLAAISLTNPGYIKFQVTSLPQYFQIAFGTATFAPGSTVVTYPLAFPNISFPLVSAGGGGAAETRNNPGVSDATATNFTAFSTLTGSTGGRWVAVGF